MTAGGSSALSAGSCDFHQAQLDIDPFPVASSTCYFFLFSLTSTQFFLSLSTTTCTHTSNDPLHLVHLARRPSARSRVARTSFPSCSCSPASSSDSPSSLRGCSGSKGDPRSHPRPFRRRSSFLLHHPPSENSSAEGDGDMHKNVQRPEFTSDPSTSPCNNDHLALAALQFNDPPRPPFSRNIKDSLVISHVFIPCGSSSLPLSF